MSAPVGTLVPLDATLAAVAYVPSLANRVQFELLGTPVVVHVRLLLALYSTAVGLAVNDEITGATPAATPTLTELLAVGAPLGQLNVAV